MYNTYYYLYRCIIHLYYFPGHPPGGGSGIMYNTPYFVLYVFCIIHGGPCSSAWRRRLRCAAAVTVSGAAAQVCGASALHGTPAASHTHSRGRCGCMRVAAPPFRWHIRLIEAYYV